MILLVQQDLKGTPLHCSLHYFSTLSSDMKDDRILTGSLATDVCFDAERFWVALVLSHTKRTNAELIIQRYCTLRSVGV